MSDDRLSAARLHSWMVVDIATLAGGRIAACNGCNTAVVLPRCLRTRRAVVAAIIQTASACTTVRPRSAAAAGAIGTLAVVVVGLRDHLHSALSVAQGCAAAAVDWVLGGAVFAQGILARCSLGVVGDAAEGRLHCTCSKETAALRGQTKMVYEAKL